MPNSRLHLKIFGQVQGVNFRSYARKQARKLNLKGWVRNAVDGCVECVAEGERLDLEKFLTWCRNGPSWSKVERVEANWGLPTQEFSGFEIMY